MAAAAPIQLAALKGVSPKRAVFAILAASAAALALLVVVLYGHGRVEGAPAWVSWLPEVNAFLNGTSAVFLVLAYRAVRRRRLAEHARHMLTALCASTLFLVSYIVYHSVHGDTKFPGQGVIRPAYFFVLISHVTLSAVTLPLVFCSFFFALSGRFQPHRKVARYAFPVWLYVSITGVLVFVLLRAYT
jgi:putative membrane protein